MEEENQEIEEKDELKSFKQQFVFKSILVFAVLGCGIAILSSAVTHYFTLKRSEEKFVSATYKIEKGKTTATDELENISEVLTTFAEIVDQQYIGDIERKTLINETIKGFIKGLGDEYSEYMTPSDWTDYKETQLGNYSGVGIVMSPGDNGYILVTSVIKDSPAEKAGVQQGDYIVGVNGESVYGESTSDVANKVRGDVSTEVEIDILKDNNEVQKFTLKRENVRVYHVLGEMLEDGIGYIYFNTFDEGCSEEFEKETDKLVEQGAKKLILDIRNNTGGDVEQALKILDLFLEKGEIELITRSARGPEITTTSGTDKKYNFENIVIITNKYTASAAEILTGALIDNGLAKTVGVKTYGKGVMQSVFSLIDGSVLKLTTQEYTTPKGTKIHGIGISPDYEIEYVKDDEIDNQLEKAKSVLKGEE